MVFLPRFVIIVVSLTWMPCSRSVGEYKSTPKQHQAGFTGDCLSRSWENYLTFLTFSFHICNMCKTFASESWRVNEETHKGILLGTWQ